MLGLLAAAAPPLAIETRATPIHDIAEIGAAIATHSRQDGGGLLVLPDSYTITNRAAMPGGKRPASRDLLEQSLRGKRRANIVWH